MNDARYVYALQEAVNRDNPSQVEELLRAQLAIGGAVFRVPVQRIEALREKLEKLNRKAAKLGTAPINLTDTGERDTDQVAVRGVKQDVEYAYVTVLGKTPALNGWAFIATMDHGPAGNIIHLLPDLARPAGLVIPPLDEFRDTGRICQHCGYMRNRKDTYLVQNIDTGEVKQVGSTCLADFTGFNNPQQAAKWFEHLNDWHRYMGGGWGPIEDPTDSLRGFMATACAAARLYGFKTAKAVEQDGFGITTASRARERMWTGNDLFEVTDEDYAKAEAVISHAQALPAVTEFEKNIKAICSAVTLKDRHMGIAAAAILIYDRAQKKDAKPEAPEYIDAFYGTKGHRETFVVECRHVGQWFERNNFMKRNVTFRDAAGHKLIWATTSDFEFEVGKNYTFTGKVGNHFEGRWGKQTYLNMCRGVKETQEAVV